jgi:N-acyl-D-aspartate/D-glutamate deacylase
LHPLEKRRLVTAHVVSGPSHDLPAGGRRLLQRADRYRATLVAGTPIFENGEETGARPGPLWRASTAGR